MDNAFILDNLREYRHKRYNAKTTFFGNISAAESIGVS